MEEQAHDPAQEAKRLRNCVNDIVGVLALAAIWRGSEPSQIIQTLLDLLLRMLGVEFAYARLNKAFKIGPVEDELRVSDYSKINLPPQELLNLLRDSLAADARESQRQIRNSSGTVEISIYGMPLGIYGEIGVIVLGSNRVGFPEKTESLLLSVAANQASLGLQEARHLSEQKRIAAELEQRVAERTQALDQINAELRKEITERKMAEQKLRQEEEELKRIEAHKAAILDSSPDSVVAIDHEGLITEFNPAAEQTFGHRREDVLGRHIGDVIIPRSLREKHRIGFARHLATGESKVLGRRVEMTALRADGNEFPVELTITRIPQDGTVAFTGHIRDITERKRSEDALRVAHAQVVRSEERWRSVFESSAVGVALTDLNGRFMAANSIFQKMLGYTEQELQELTFVDVTHEEDRDRSATLTRELLASERQQFQIEKKYLRKDGSFVWGRNNVSIVPGTERMPRFVMALVEDITQRKLSEEALAKARSELAKVARITSLGVLTASMAHEVNQPLSGIITNASTGLRMLSVDPPNIDGARETVRRTLRDGNRAADVISRLRTLYNKKEPALESMDLNDAAKEVTALWSTEIQRTGVILRQEYAADLPSALGDRIQLQQVILNLLRNAADAMNAIDDRPRELIVKTERDAENQIQLSVKDSGVGLTAQAAEKIFEAFYTTKADGMGIGLSISRSIIEAHQGRLWATRNDGPGSTFSFSIPCRPESLTDTKIRVDRADPSTDAA